MATASRRLLVFSIILAAAGAFGALLIVRSMTSREPSVPAGVPQEPSSSAPPARPVSPDTTISFVILSPEIAPGSDAQAEAANLFCDRLAERLSQGDNVVVVDRSQLDRILAE